MAETLDGTLKQVTFRGADGFVVARVEIAGKQQVTVVGSLGELSEGVPLRLTGEWIVDRKWGRQFRAKSYETRAPTTIAGIQTYLASAAIPGVGPALARAIVAKFGLATLDVIRDTPERLTEVAGVGTARAAKIAESARQQREQEGVRVFLAGLGISGAFAARIVKRYGKGAIEVIRANPYRLARDVWGIGFRTADGIAERLGIARDSPERIEAGILFALQEGREEGHMLVPDEELVRQTSELLSIDAGLVPPRLGALVAAGHAVRELLGAFGPCTMLPELYQAESEGAMRLAALVREPARGLALDAHAAIHAFEATTGVTLAKQQRAAVQAALVDRCTVITGGPGVGKTTIVKAIVHLARLVKRRVALAAPTGRAAKRLSEATQAEATTIHRLLEYQPHEGRFARDATHPLDVDIVVIDESSMVDALLFHSLLEAMRLGTQLVLVGDVDQLPSVGAGSVLADVIASDAATVIRLTEIFRQAAESKIVLAAHAIDRGELPDLETPAGAATSDFYFVAREDPESARAAIVELVADRIPARFGFDPISDVQVLAPMHRGALGTAALNQALQERLNPAAAGVLELTRGDRVFRRGDKVMQLRNDYDKNVYNGDIGAILAIDPEEGILRVDFDGRGAEYDRSELDQLAHAYCVSIHKSQGSEYPAVVIPLATQHYMMLQRSLLYTAVTRGKKLVILVGNRRAVSMAVKNADAKRRFTYFAERVRALLS
ncbi:MAG TPA: ATP-dependent RecD-like DNA helicase [Kofleriaceae bacterium]|jgi:exodeoxyribonuclease V alpha subunit